MRQLACRRKAQTRGGNSAAVMITAAQFLKIESLPEYVSGACAEMRNKYFTTVFDGFILYTEKFVKS